MNFYSESETREIGRAIRAYRDSRPNFVNAIVEAMGKPSKPKPKPKPTGKPKPNKPY